MTGAPEESRPLGIRSDLGAPFWEAARARSLVVQRCDDCGAFRHYPQYRCPDCRGEAWTWTPVSGRGTVYSFTVTHQAFHPWWASRVPYAVATIELEEGVRMVSDLPPEDLADLAIDAPVEVYFEDVGPETTLPRFRLRR